jgi:hypothetical protein
MEKDASNLSNSDSDGTHVHMDPINQPISRIRIWPDTEKNSKLIIEATNLFFKSKYIWMRELW